MKNLGIIGTGNMAEALISGLLTKKVFLPKNICGFDIQRERLDFVRKKYRIDSAPSPMQVVKKCGVILLAVKPQQMGEVLSSIAIQKQPSRLWISIAAGLDSAFFRQHLPDKARLIRVMPNAPALVGLGVSAYFVTRSCHKNDRRIVQKIFSSVGIATEVQRESLLDAVTGLSGSGPAFVYLFLDALIEGGKRGGLPEKLARDLAVQTLLGASTLFQKSGLKPKELISKVASKGGTTEKGLAVLQKKNLKGAVIHCVEAATQRAKELRRY